MICDRVIESHVKREFTKISDIGSTLFKLVCLSVHTKRRFLLALCTSRGIAYMTFAIFYCRLP